MWEISSSLGYLQKTFDATYVTNVRSKKPDRTTTFPVGPIPSKSADASLLNNLLPEQVQTRKNSAAGLTSLALHLARTLQISKYFQLPETKAAVRIGERLSELR